MMVRYFYAWIPIVIVGTVAILSAPWLGLFALVVLLLAALAAVGALAWATVAALHALGGFALGCLVAGRARGRRDAREPLVLNPRGVGERGMR
jgi:hypothetical protein